MLLAVCTDPNLLQVVLIAKKIIQILEIVGPLGVVLYASIDVVKAVTSKDQSSIKKQLDMIPKRLLAMAILFFVPMLVDITMSIADNEFEYSACFKNATQENIESLFVDMANEKIAEVRTVMSDPDWLSHNALYALEDAKGAINKIVDEQTRATYESIILELQQKIDARKKEEDANSLEGPLVNLRENAYAAPDAGFKFDNNQPGDPGTGGGELPYISQCDPQWTGSTYYGETYCSSACGATSLAMVLSGLSGKTVTPIDVYNRMIALGIPATFVSHDAFTNTALLGTWGVKGTPIPTGSNKSATKEGFDSALGANKPIIANIPGHYVVIDHMKDGKYHVLDPGRSQFNKYYTWDELWHDIIVNYIGRDYSRYTYFYYERV